MLYTAIRLYTRWTAKATPISKGVDTALVQKPSKYFLQPATKKTTTQRCAASLLMQKKKMRDARGSLSQPTAPKIITMHLAANQLPNEKEFNNFNKNSGHISPSLCTPSSFMATPTIPYVPTVKNLGTKSIKIQLHLLFCHKKQSTQAKLSAAGPTKQEQHRTNNLICSFARKQTTPQAV